MAAPRVCLGRLKFMLQFLKDDIQSCPFPRISKTFTRGLSTTSRSESDEANTSVSVMPQTKTKQISRAMKAYLEQATKRDEFMKSEIAEYEIGKRHLAHIMGADPDNFTQEDVDKAIEYLLPSGLYDKKARPMVKHPIDIIPKRKLAQFDIAGRPFHYLFYTSKPNYYQILHEAALKIEELKKIDDENWAKTKNPADPAKQINLSGSEWLKQRKIEEMLQEKINEHDYLRFIKILDRIASLPFSKKEEEFVMQYRKSLISTSLLEDIPAPIVDAEIGIPYMDAQGRRKSSAAKVRVWDKGRGNFTVNGKELYEHFPNLIDREQIMFPLQFVGRLGDVDVDATVENGGPTGQAGAIRLATSKALQSFVPSTMVEQMRLAGLLTSDPRRRERKKPGQKGARKKFTWKKR